MMPLGQQENGLSQDGPLLGLALLACAIWISKLWLDDYRSREKARPGALPGATACTREALWIASMGALGILLLETLCEKVVGLDAEQSTIAWHFLAAMVAAAVLEELVFRGYLVVSGKGRALLIGSAAGFSLLFALAHPYLWTFDGEAGLALHFDSDKAWLTTSFLFFKSLWFYYARFASWNPRHSLLPCVVAHLAINLATFVIKAGQGYVAW
jgi:membrane protease YdiL (CAAX protease family)